MNNFIETFFGHGTDLNILQMCTRAFVMFFITLGIIRLSGRRTFGIKTPFDTIMSIMLGAVLSRAVIGASPFIPTVFAGLVLAVIHRLLAIASLYSEKLSVMIKGKEQSLFKNGRMNKSNLEKTAITKGDLMEGVRLNGNVYTLDDIEEVIMERTGELSVIKKEK
jgi:uncharacterized membrane protein YcaP (DUF421 family)